MEKPRALLKETDFNFDELFFSTTNERGVIQYGNDVFIRISGYPKETMIGAPHSIIRHPDMPRAVFKLFWNTIQSGQPIAAYVKNMAADGSYYWVFAFVFPIEGGYLSIRVKPSSSFFDAARLIYTNVLEYEKDAGLEASFAFLTEQILGGGFKSYTDFMIQAAFAELNSLEEKNSKNRDIQMSGSAGEIAQLSQESSAILKDCFQKIQGFQDSNNSFIHTMTELSESFKRLKYISLNMTISSAKFQETGASLGVVSKEFSKVADEIQEHLSSLLNFVEVVSSEVEKSARCAVGLDTQMMMVDFFIRESIQKMTTSENAFAEMLDHRQFFSALFRQGTGTLGHEIGSLETHLSNVLEKIMEVRKLTTGLEVIRQMGAVESARETEIRQTFTHYLEEMQKFISLLQSTTHVTHKEMQQMKVHCHAITQSMQLLSGRVDAIFDLASNTMTAAV